MTEKNNTEFESKKYKNDSESENLKKKTTTEQPVENKMGTMKISKLILNISIPIMISMLVQALYNIVDSIFVARLSINALTAVSLAFPIQNLMIAVGIGVGVGVNACLSMALGGKKFVRVNKIAMQGVFLGAVGCLIFFIFGLFGTKYFMSFQTSNPEIIRYGSSYMKVCTMFCFGVFMQVLFERLLQSTGKSFYSMFSQGIGAIINIILDPMFIFGFGIIPRMEVAGAAVATVIGQIVAAFIALYFNLRKNKEIKFDIKNIKPDFNIIFKILSIGVPSMLMVSIFSITLFSLNYILSTFTLTAVALLGVYFKIQSIIFMPIFGLNNGLVPIVAYNYGAKNKERIRQAIKTATIYAVSIMMFGLFIFQTMPVKLLFLFNASEEMIKIGIPAFRTISLSFVFAGFCVISMGVFQALGKGIYSLISAILRQLIFLVPVAYILSLFRNLNIVWLAFPIAEIATLIPAINLLKRKFKKLENL
ncbi:MAG: MATE family efflux transporter [Fusobacteriaceae bacterium]|nr:MATE family efflux transporter [Fusobacteriaceae bacterium]